MRARGLGELEVENAKTHGLNVPEARASTGPQRLREPKPEGGWYLPAMANPSDGLITFFSDDHRECDDLWAVVEAAANVKDESKAKSSFAEFAQRLERHLKLEEEILFPAFEAATGMRGGPTAVMRSEHVRMRAVVAEMERRLGSGDLEGLLDQGDTLLMLIQQHNAKEEGMLYPMAEQHLQSQWDAIAAQLASAPY